MTEVDQMVVLMYEREIDYRQREIACYLDNDVRVVEAKRNTFVDVTDDRIATLRLECARYDARIASIRGVQV